MFIFFAILVFGMIIFVHELGHYLAARKAGIRVVEFSIGMGPRLLKFTRGETMYSLKLFPIGGSCRMLGDEDKEEGAEPDPRSFNSKSVPWRMLVILGGGIANFLFALVLAILISMFNVQQDRYIMSFPENSPAQAAGLLEGDRVIRVNGRRIATRGDVNFAMLSADGRPIDIRVNRDGQRLDFTLNPMYRAEENRWLLGISFGVSVGTFANAPEGYQDAPGWRRMGFFENFAVGANTVDFYIRATLTGLGRLIRYGFNFDEIMGPIGIVGTVGGDVTYVLEAEGGGVGPAFWTLMQWTAILSATLGMMNLLPIPALDGAHMVFLAIEGIRRKPIPPERQGMINLIGFVLLMGLFVIVAYHDILRFF
ncbi:MAG: site-2 protease family protein [Clostridiales bacterium]|nr:site-2 protease family protein [Clostridiales bacterium]